MTMRDDIVIPLIILVGIVVLGFLIATSGKPKPVCDKLIDPDSLQSVEQLFAMCN